MVSPRNGSVSLNSADIDRSSRQCSATQSMRVGATLISDPFLRSGVAGVDGGGEDGAWVRVRVRVQVRGFASVGVVGAGRVEEEGWGFDDEVDEVVVATCWAKTRMEEGRGLDFEVRRVDGPVSFGLEWWGEDYDAYECCRLVRTDAGSEVVVRRGEVRAPPPRPPLAPQGRRRNDASRARRLRDGAEYVRAPTSVLTVPSSRGGEQPGDRSRSAGVHPGPPPTPNKRV